MCVYREYYGQQHIVHDTFDAIGVRIRRLLCETNSSCSVNNKNKKLEIKHFETVHAFFSYSAINNVTYA